MKTHRLHSAVFSILLLIPFFGCGLPSSGNAQQPLVPGTWQLQFEDNFNGSVVDGAKWRMGSHHAGIAGLGGNSPQNITVSNGALQLKAEQRAVTYSGKSFSYATGEVSTFFNYRQQHGYMEARVKYPAVTGLWPAFWLMPDRGDYGWKDIFYRSYLKFDLTSSGLSTVSSATLKLKVSAVESGGTNNLVFMKLGDDSWGESTITWNNMPAPNPVWIAQRWNNQVSPGDEITVDVTDYVAEQIAGDKVVSLVIADTFLRTKFIKFHSREAANAADRPQLVINGTPYNPSADATVRWGTLANTNYGSAVDLTVKDNWGNTADTFNGGMEVDILESLGIWGANVTSHALHWDGYGSQHKSFGWGQIPYPATPDGFHTYGVYWEPGLLAFYVDGVKTGEYVNSRVMSVPAYMILSLQLGGWDGNNPGPQVHNQVMEVDWVRSWSGTRAQPAPVIADNATPAQTLTQGSWTVSNAVSGHYAANYAHDQNSGKGSKAFHFFPALLADDDYAVYGRWTSDANRATNVPVHIVSRDESVTTQIVNQQQNGGQWRLLDGFALSAANAEVIVSNEGTNGYVIADAFRFVPAGNRVGAITVDDAATAQVQSTGTWVTSSHTGGYHGSGYQHDDNTGKGSKSFTFQPSVPTAGDYFVYARWTSGTNRASNVPIDIVSTSGMTTVEANQRVAGGQWHLLGAYQFAAGNASITLRNDGTNGYVIADAVMLVPVPQTP